MRYSVVPSEDSVKIHGLPWSVVLIEPRTSVAAFKDERAASLMCNQLNGFVEKEAVATQGQNLADRLPKTETTSEDFAEEHPDTKKPKLDVQPPQPQIGLQEQSKASDAAKPTEMSLADKVKMAQNTNVNK